jgi:hypothetical protein
MTGIGRNASPVRRSEVKANTAPTRTMFQKVEMIVEAPRSRNRSSWLTSSFRTASRPPLELSSNQASSRSWMCR